MPANLTPDYLKAERWFREATTTEEKILALEEMLRVIPKHKGTDHLKADLRRKLSALKESVVHPKGKGAGFDIFHIQHSGCGQVALIGTPNCGKSSIVAALTNAKVHVADFPFATTAPVPGMVQFEDVHFQLIDMPPITADYIAPGQVGTYRNCDLIAIVIDLSANVVEQMRICMDYLQSKNLLTDEHGTHLGKKVICICTKLDIAQPDAIEKLKAGCTYPLEFIEISTQTAEGLGKLAPALFNALGLIRVYAKPPGKKPDMTEPFTLPAGSTVLDLARAIHRELGEKLKYARIWGTDVYEGQNVQRTHVLNDKDIVELHFA
jgi:ribosome-interacting GTPase 1